MQFQLTLESWVLASDGLAYISAAATVSSMVSVLQLILLPGHTPVQSLAFLKNLGCSRKYSLATTASCTAAKVT